MRSSEPAAKKQNLNENYRRINLKFKSYSRGTGRMKGEAFKRKMWKLNMAKSDGKRGDRPNRGRPGWRGGGKGQYNRTEDTCFKCGNKGHWSSNCTGRYSCSSCPAVCARIIAISIVLLPGSLHTHHAWVRACAFETPAMIHRPCSE